MIPAKVWWQAQLADAYIRYLYPRKRGKKAQRAGGLLSGVWDYKPDRKRPWQPITREINEALRAIEFNPKQRRQKNVALLFALAMWAQHQAFLPKTSLATCLDDERLFQILQLYGEVPATAYGFCDLTPLQIRQLEKRLHQRWPDVRRMLDAINSPKKHLRNANKLSRIRSRLPKTPTAAGVAAELMRSNS